MQTTGFTGADLANLVNEAALLAGRSNKGAAGGGSQECALKVTAGGQTLAAGCAHIAKCALLYGSRTLLQGVR